MGLCDTLYDSSHNARRWPENPAVRGRVDRESYLKRLQPADRPKPDVDRVRVVLDVTEARRVTEELKTVGLRATGPLVVELRAGGGVLEIVPTVVQASAGVEAIQ